MAIPSIPRRTRLFFYWFLLGTAFGVLRVDELVLSIFDSVVSGATSVLPAYTRPQQTDIAIKIPQVAVLYFAVLIAAVQFTNEEQQFAYESDPLLYLFLPLSIVLVSFSALSAILSVLGISPKISLVTSLGLMGVAFFLSSLATVITGVGKVNEQDRLAGKRSDDQLTKLDDMGHSTTETDESTDQTTGTDTPEPTTEATDDTDETCDKSDSSPGKGSSDTENLEGKE